MNPKVSPSCIFRREFWLQLRLPLMGGGTAQMRACRFPSVAREHGEHGENNKNG